MASTGDGLIMSSFQVLEHRDDVSKAGHDLDHFLHPYDQADRLSGDEGEWKTTGIQHMTCRQEASNQPHGMPDIHTLNASDHTGSSFLNDFRSDGMPGTPENQQTKLLAVGQSRRTDDDDDDEEDEGDDGEEGSDDRGGPSMKHCLQSLGDKRKAGGFDDIHVETPDLLTSHKQGFIEMDSGLVDHAFMNPATAGDSWSQGMDHSRGDTTANDWTADDKRMSSDVTHLEEPEAGKSWDFLHADQHVNQNIQVHHQWLTSGDKLLDTDMTSHHCHEGWGPGAKMMTAQSNEPWGEKNQAVAEGHHGLIPATNVESPSAHWSKQGRQVTADGIPWMQDVGGVYPVDSDGANVCKMFQMPSTSSDGVPVSTVTTFAELRPADSCGSQWPLDSQTPPARSSNFPARVAPVMDNALCRRLTSPACLRGMPSHGYHRYQGPTGGQQEVWPQQAHTPTPMRPTSPMPRCVDPASAMQAGPLCPTPVLGKRSAKAVVSRRAGVTVTSTPAMAQAADVPKTRPLLDQARKQAHPYLMKDSKKGARDVFPGTGANVHTLKASHIVSWYIDYLIHENEHLTQISRAFSLPVNLFHSDDFYFMESVKKKVHFPSIKFLSWMQQNLPSINVNAVDFHEGRPPVVSVWNQDWFWQNKSRRDIIHDVFFYFQHRRVTCAI